MWRASMKSTLSGAVGAGLALVEEPEGAGQGDGEEEIRADGDHDVHMAGADDLFPDLLLGGAGIGGGVRHDESGAALLFSAEWKCWIQR